MFEKHNQFPRNTPPKKSPSMKLFLFCAATLTSLTLNGLAQAPVGPGAVKLGKVLPAVVKTPEFQITGAQNKRYKLGEWLEVEVEFETKLEDIDELTFKYTMLVEKKILDGEVTYVNIPKGREHYSVMYVAPRSLEKLAGGKAITASAIENVWVEVSHNGLVLDKVSLRPTAIPNAQHISSLVLNKNETPFAPLYFDRYEAIKKSR
ncbi:MAG: hypothetical protein JWL90_3489 [Chthoniobacteraceae bacterium]|nr:hypothetical protein [Chthoniobacteraceae bacterium]MDB6171914.1 hypothetical protein [Chthoniobacteraceae bacterium]